MPRFGWRIVYEVQRIFVFLCRKFHPHRVALAPNCCLDRNVRSGTKRSQRRPKCGQESVCGFCAMVGALPTVSDQPAGTTRSSLVRRTPFGDGPTGRDAALDARATRPGAGTFAAVAGMGLVARRVSGAG